MNPIITTPSKVRRLIGRLRLCHMRARFMRGQTMTEYALILAAIAIVVYVTYQSLGTEIKTLLQQIVTDLTPPSSG
jgi:Flp pilus assembly pilin Flp